MATKEAAVELFKELLLESNHGPTMIMAYKGTISFRAAKLAEEMGL